ncbi:hypothetical protein Syun_019870 [Stephania yunnanensis]|uniref:Uncharacterized protein n=1 Tax=Stephania yunnanensis TaxID=152371 RepID=A0AAP0IWM1_9MAGN
MREFDRIIREMERTQREIQALFGKAIDNLVIIDKLNLISDNDNLTIDDKRKAHNLADQVKTVWNDS